MNLFPSRNRSRPTTVRELNPRVDPYAEERERIRQSRSEGQRFDPLSRDLLEFYSSPAPVTVSPFGRGSFGRPREIDFNNTEQSIPVNIRSPFFNQPSAGGSTLLEEDDFYQLQPRDRRGLFGFQTIRRRDSPEDIARQRISAYHRHLDAEARAGRRLSPGNQALIDYYSSDAAGRASERRQETPSPTPFLGRESSSPTFTGSSNPVFRGRQGSSFIGADGETFQGSQAPLFIGRDSITDYRLFGPQGVFLGRGSVADPVSSETVVETSGIADGIVGMMGGGLVGSRTPFRKGRAMDRMVSEMTRNISRR